MTMTEYKTITGKEANTLDIVPITREYSEYEYSMLDKAIAQLKGKTYYLVKTRDGILIARPRKEVNTLKDDHTSTRR